MDIMIELEDDLSGTPDRISWKQMIGDLLIEVWSEEEPCLL